VLSLLHAFICVKWFCCMITKCFSRICIFCFATFSFSLYFAAHVSGSLQIFTIERYWRDKQEWTYMCVYVNCRTPLHCAASCNNIDVVRLLVENGAAVFTKTVTDEETALNKCGDGDGSFTACLQYLTGSRLFSEF